MDTRLYYIEFMRSPLGICDLKWFLDEGEAAAERDRMIREEGFRFDEDLAGVYGIRGPFRDDVDLSPTGILGFANAFAIDRGAC
jgi:hypothetical protein